jgi:hypothetical protein
MQHYSDIYWERRLHVDYVAALMSSLFIGASSAVLAHRCTYAERCTGAYVIVVAIILRKLARLPSSTTRRILMYYTVTMLLLALGWYASAAIANAKPLSGLDTIASVQSSSDLSPPSAIPAEYIRDALKLLQICGADGLLVSGARVI